MTRRRDAVVGLVLMISMLACIIPGLSQPAPPPAYDPNMISTWVVLTANVLMSQTAGATQVVLETPTSPPAEMPAAASTQVLTFSSFGTALQKHADGSTLYVDQTAGYEFIAPPGWTLVRPNEPEYYELWTAPIAGNPAVKGMLTKMQSMDSNLVRVYGFDLREGHLIRDDFILNFDVQLGRDLTGSYTDMFDRAKAIYSSRESLSHFNVLSSKVMTTPGNVEAGVMEIEFRGNLSDPDVVTYEKQLILKAQSGYFFVRFDILEDFKAQTLAEFDQLVASIKPFTP